MLRYWGVFSGTTGPIIANGQVANTGRMAGEVQSVTLQFGNNNASTVKQLTGSRGGFQCIHPGGQLYACSFPMKLDPGEDVAIEVPITESDISRISQCGTSFYGEVEMRASGFSDVATPLVAGDDSTRRRVMKPCHKG